MATFDEIFQRYVAEGFTKSTPGVSYVEPVSPIETYVEPVSGIPSLIDSDGDGTTVGPTSTGKGTGSISMSDIAKAVGFAINPPLGLLSMGFETVTGKTPMQAVQDTLASMGIGTAATGPTAPGAGMGFGGGYATDVGFGGMGIGPGGVDQGTGPGGCDAGPSADQGTGPGGCDSGTAGPSADSGTGPGGCSNGGGDGGDGGGGSGAGGGDAGSGPGGCGYAKGGRVGFMDGTDYMDFINRLADINAGLYSPSEGLLPGYTYDPETETFTNPMGLRMTPQAYRQEILYYTPPEKTTPTEDFSDYLNQSTDTTSPDLDEYIAELKRLGFDPHLIQGRVTAEEKFKDQIYHSGFTNPGPDTPENRAKHAADLRRYGYSPEEIDFQLKNSTLFPSLAAGVYQTTNPNIIGYSPSEPAITALPEAQEDFSDYLNGLTPNWSPGDPAPEGYEIVSGAGDTWIEPIARTLFPQTNLQQIKETATSPTQYNIEATKDLVENLPGFIQPFAPAAAGIMSIPYDAIQAYQRMQPGSGLGGFAEAYAAERPLQSAYERFVGASGPLAENINKAVSSLNPFQQQQYMQYAAQNPEQARAAAQRNQEFVQATQRENQATGGRIGYSNGSSDKIDYWITVQEMYDNAGGEAGTGLGLIDFANKYFPKMEDGGRPGYLQGGLVNLLR